jgi:hypothetical protein
LYLLNAFTEVLSAQRQALGADLISSILLAA